MSKSLAIRLLVISNLFVAGASVLSGFAIFLHIGTIAYIASALAGIGALLAIWQGTQAGQEQEQFVNEQIKSVERQRKLEKDFEEDLKRAKQFKERLTISIFSVGIIVGTILHYWLHPEKRPTK